MGRLLDEWQTYGTRTHTAAATDTSYPSTNCKKSCMKSVLGSVLTTLCWHYMQAFCLHINGNRRLTGTPPPVAYEDEQHKRVYVTVS